MALQIAWASSKRLASEITGGTYQEEPEPASAVDDLAESAKVRALGCYVPASGGTSQYATACTCGPLVVLEPAKIPYRCGQGICARVLEDSLEARDELWPSVICSSCPCAAGRGGHVQPQRSRGRSWQGCSAAYWYQQMGAGGVRGVRCTLFSSIMLLVCHS